MTEVFCEDLEEKKEKVVLAGLCLPQDKDFDHSMEELEELAKACDMEVTAIAVQRMPAVNKALYVGKGKVEQIRQLAEESGAVLVIFDKTLTPMQLRNLQKELGLAVMDRTTLILEIFSKRAGTREAKLQVETASLKYMLPRLVGLHEALSRQGGASGSMSNRGAGEKKLELDRRHIEARLLSLEKELAKMEKDRESMRKRRQKSTLPLVSLVGYTNAGKSTLMNRLLERYNKGDEENAIAKQVLEKDMLFATLETSVRRMEGEGGRQFLLSDTVGFINDLPHALIKAFRSTLEEVRYADLLLHVVDRSDPYYREHMKVTRQTIEELGAGKIPEICVFNKMDLLSESPDGEDYPKIVGNQIYVAAGGGVGLEELAALIEATLFGNRKEYALFFPYAAGGEFSRLQEETEILSTSYEEKGISVKAALDNRMAGKYREYIIHDEGQKEEQ